MTFYPSQIASGKTSKAVPGQYTTDRSVMPDTSGIEALADEARKRVQWAASKAKEGYGAESEEYRLLAEIRDRKSSVESEQARMRYLFQRWDNLYFPSAITDGGADHWPEGVKP